MRKIELLFLGVGFFCGATIVIKILGCYCERIISEKKRFEHYFSFLVRVVQEKVILNSVFEENNIKTVAIYGYGNVSESVRNILKKNGIETKYFIDRRAQDVRCKHQVYSLQQQWEKVDAVIVIPVDYEEISNIIKRKMDCMIIPLEKTLA